MLLYWLKSGPHKIEKTSREDQQRRPAEKTSREDQQRRPAEKTSREDQ